MRSWSRLAVFVLSTMASITVVGCSGGGSSSSPGPTPASTYTIGGTIAGLTGTGLVLQNDGGNNLTVSASATSFTFATAVPSGGGYDVTILTQPSGQTCVVSSGSGTASATVTTVTIACTSPDTISGTITGLTGTGLVLQDNGGNNLTVSANATSFSFSTAVNSGGAYSVSVLTQPAGESCTVSNGSGTATANVTNISIACVPAYIVGGSVFGLSGAGLVLQDNGGNNVTVAANASSYAFTFPGTVPNGGVAYSVTVLANPAG